MMGIGQNALVAKRTPSRLFSFASLAPFGPQQSFPTGNQWVFWYKLRRDANLFLRAVQPPGIKMHSREENIPPDVSGLKSKCAGKELLRNCEEIILHWPHRVVQLRCRLVPGQPRRFNF